LIRSQVLYPVELQSQKFQNESIFFNWSAKITVFAS